MLLAGLVSFCVGLLAVILLAQGSASALVFTVPLMFMGLGTGCMIAPLSTEAMRHVPAPLAGAASGVNNTVRQLGSVLGSAAATAQMAAGATPLAGIHLAMALAVVLLGLAGTALLATRAGQPAAVPA